MDTRLGSWTRCTLTRCFTYTTGKRSPFHGHDADEHAVSWTRKVSTCRVTDTISSLGFIFRVLGSRFLVPDFRFQISGCGFQVPDFGLRVSGTDRSGTSRQRESLVYVASVMYLPPSLSLSLFLSLSLSVLNPVLIPHDQTKNRLGQGCRVQG